MTIGGGGLAMNVLTMKPLRLSVFLSMAFLLMSVGGASSNEHTKTRNMYTIRPPSGVRRRAVEIIDLGTFLLTNSDDGRPKPIIPFYLNIFETRAELSDGALQNVEDATSDFLLTELNTIYMRNFVSNVQTRIVSQERFVEEIDESNRMRRLVVNDRGQRQLIAVPGTKFKVNVNVTFDREPSPDAADVDESLQLVMKDLTNLVDNVTATEDPELGHVFMAYREEISEANENPTTVAIEKPVPENRGGQSMKFIIPILVALVLLGAIIALFVIKRRRRRVQAANQKVQEDLAFLDEETNVFSYENSPTKSSAKKRMYDVSDPENYDGDESSRYSTSQGSIEPNSPSYGMIPGIGSPTARSSLSGASTVKVSNTRLMPLPSKLTEIGSTSLFAFSEEDEDLDSSAEANNPRSPVSLQRSEASNGSSFNRIMNEEEGISSIASSPRHEVTSPTSTVEGSTATNGQQASSKSTIASFFSSHFFSGGDSVSQFAGSALTVRAANTTEAVKKKAATKRVRSFSLSPKIDKNTPLRNHSPRAKSEAGGDDESTDSVFDFLAASPKLKVPQEETSDSKTPQERQQDLELQMKSLDEVLADGSITDTEKPIAESTVSPSKDTHSNNASLVSEEKSSPNKTPGTPHGPSPAVAAMPNDIYDEDSLSDDDAPGSFPRRSRRHAKSTTQDGTSTYQTNAMQPQDWSMTDGLSDDDTLSEQGGGLAAFGAFPRSGFRSPKSAQKKVDQSAEPSSPSNLSRSTYSAVTQSSRSSKADSSQASASRQLINDLVWLSKKIAGVKQSAVESAPGEASALGVPPEIEPVDSLSYTSQDGLISPTTQTGAQTNAFSQETPKSQNSATATGTNALNASIVCRDCFAPPGKLNIVIHSTKDGPAVHEVKDGSCLEGSVYPGDLIISVDDIDTRAFTAAQLMKMMSERSQSERKITVLHFENTAETANSQTVKP